MNFESYMYEVLKEQYEDMMSILYGFNDENMDLLYLDRNSEFYLSDKDFLKDNKKMLLNEEMMDAVYTFITQISLLEKTDITRMVAYLGIHYYKRHYNDKKAASVLKYLMTTEIDKIVELFFENEDFGIDMVNSFYLNQIDEDNYNLNSEMIKDDNKSADLEKLEKIAFPDRIFTINQKLREIICNLYNHHISNGCDDALALELTWAYFYEDLDPLRELEQLGCDEEHKNFYKLYILGLIVGDLYEDTANTPLVDTESYEGRMAQVIPVLLTISGRVNIPNDPVVRGRMLKYFILLQDDPQKKKSNREKTHSEGREYQLKKVNPTYVLDELTF